MKKVLFMLLVTLSVITLVGCSGKEKLYVLNWGEYIDMSLIDKFEKEFDVKVKYDVSESNELMYQRIKAGATKYDIVIPSDYMIEKLINEEMLLEINFNNVPNYKHIDDRFKNLDYDPNNKYSVPYFWGTLGIMYNTDQVTEEVKSWDILFDEKYNKNIYMYDSLRDSFAVALKKLGYSLNETDESKLNQAKQLLMDQKSLIYAYGTDIIKDSIINGSVALGVVYNGDYLDKVYELEEEGTDVNIGYAVPEEGSNLWFDAMVIPNTSQNKDLAEKFINFMSDPENAITNTEYVGYSTVNKTAYDTLMEDDENIEWLTDPAYYPSQEVIDKSEVFKDLGSAGNELYERLWSEIKSH